MDRLTFNWILQVALLKNDGVADKDLLFFCKNQKLVKLGVELCKYINKIKV